MNRRDLELHLQDLFDGCLKGEALEALTRELRSNPEAREAYREYFHLHNALRFRGKGVDLLNVVPMDRVIQRRQRRYLRTAGLAAAAVLMFGALGMALILTRSPTPSLTFATSPGTDFRMSHEPTDGAIPEGHVLEPGSRMEVRHGTVELEFASGVRGIVRGPAEFVLRREDLLELAAGTVWFEVPEAAAGFQVTTPELVLTDLGTEFGIISKPDFLDQVHVFAGKVDVVHRKGLRRQLLLQADQARVSDPSGRWKAIPVRHEPFLKELPSAEPKPSVIVSEEVSNQQFAFAGDVSNSDLLHRLKPTGSGWNLKNHADPGELVDGIHGAHLDEVKGDRVQGAWTRVGATAEFHLGRGPNGLGFDLTSVQSIAAWHGEGFANQCWTVEVKPAGGSFRELAVVSCNPFKSQNLKGGGATKVTLTDKTGMLAEGIESIRFTAGRVDGSVDNAFVWREVDVFGQPTKP